MTVERASKGVGEPVPATGETEPENEAAASQFIGGALLALLGAGALYVGSGYRMGSSLNMGAGYFPRMIAAALLLLGIILVVKGWLAGLRAIPSMPVRPTVAIIGATLTFGYLVDKGGLFLACALAVVIASLGGTGGSVTRVALTALVLAASASLIFSVGLGLSLPVFPRSWIF